MELDVIDREEFDRRLQSATEQMRRERLGLEARAAELENLISRYSGLLERVEAGRAAESLPERRAELRRVLTELAERTSGLAAAL